MTERKSKSISESTPITLGLSISALAGVIAVTAYVTSISVKAEATAKDVADIQADRKEKLEKNDIRWMQITNDITEIKTDLKYLRKKGN